MSRLIESLRVGDWDWRHILAAVIAVQIVPLIPTWFAIFLSSLGGDGDMGKLLLNYGLPLEILKFFVFVLAPIVIVSLLRRGLALQSDFGLCWGDWVRVIQSVVVGYTIFAVATQIFERTIPGAPEAAKQVGSSFGLGQTVSRDAMVVFLVSIAAPVGEEFLFRGFLFRAIRDGLMNSAPWFRSRPILCLLMAAFLSSFAFMDSHGGDGQDLQLLMIGLMGLIAAIAYAWSGSLFSGVLIHSINNSYAMHVLSKDFVDPTMGGWVLAACPVVAVTLVHLLGILLTPRLIR